MLSTSHDAVTQRSISDSRLAPTKPEQHKWPQGLEGSAGAAMEGPEFKSGDEDLQILASER